MGPPAKPVLVVDDYPLFQMLAAEQLDLLGFASEAADSAAGAMRKLRGAGNGFAAAIIDIGLPDSKGDQLVREVRTTFPTLPVIIASGCADDELNARFKGDDRVAILNKPYGLEQLRKVLNELQVFGSGP